MAKNCAECFYWFPFVAFPKQKPVFKPKFLIMALINCIEPVQCPGKIDTVAACKTIKALMGLRSLLENQLSQPLNALEQQVRKAQLDFVTSSLDAFKLKNQETEYNQFIRQSESGLTVGPVTRTLYLVCTQGHSNYYEIECVQ